MKGLNGWISLLQDSDTAVLSSLLEELERITDSAESSATQLAEVLLKDSSLTSNVIKIANSAHFNPGAVPVTTISRAIVNIGFKSIRSFCLSLKLLETILRENPSPLLIETLAKTLHAANQAKVLCEELNLVAQEEVYVALMMSQLAELLVLSSVEEDAKAFISLVDAESDHAEKDRVAEKTLGVSITRLSRALMKCWRIEGLVKAIYSPGDIPDKRVRAIQLGNEISRTALKGWDSPEFLEVLALAAKFKGISTAAMKKKILETADLSAKTIEQYDRSVLNGHIPTSRNSKSKTAHIKRQGAKSGAFADAEKQLEILQALTVKLTESFDINDVFKLVLEGMHLGVGLERVTLMLFDSTNQKLQAKYCLGSGVDSWFETFVIRYAKSRSGFLYNLFDRDRTAWIGSDDYRDVSQYLGSEFKGITGQDEFFIAPLSTKTKPIGVLYADMGVTGRAFEADNFAGFCLFSQQLKLALTLLAAR